MSKHSFALIEYTLQNISMSLCSISLLVCIVMSNASETFNHCCFSLQGLSPLQEGHGTKGPVMLMVQVKVQNFRVILMWFTSEAVALFWLLIVETRQLERSNSMMMIVLTNTTMI